jgi:beta-glucosidase
VQFACRSEIFGRRHRSLLPQATRRNPLQIPRRQTILGRCRFCTPGPPPLPTIVDDQTAHELYLKDYEYPLHARQALLDHGFLSGLPDRAAAAQPGLGLRQPLTLTTILRGQWDFRGFVLSDYGATHSVHALLSGQDQEYPGTGLGGLIPSYFTTELKPLVDPTSTSYDPLYAMALQDAVARVLYAYERFGLLECASPAGPVAGCAPPPRPDINDLKNADAGIVERLSEEAAVLLKNDGAALPLQGAELHQ